MTISNRPELELVYLASTYSDPDPNIRRKRYTSAMAACRLLLSSHPFWIVYSPIVHWHNIATLYSLPVDFAAWSNHDQLMIEKSDQLLILASPRWPQSKGIQAEIKIAQSLNKPIHLYDPILGDIREYKSYDA